MVPNGTKQRGLMTNLGGRMIKRILSFLWFFAVIIIFIVVVFYVKNQSFQTYKKNTYTTWQKQYVVKTNKGSYINTSSNSKKGIVLSESQGYGMLISVLADNQKSSEQQFYSLYKYYEKHRIKNTNLMSWRYIDGGKNTKNDIINNATDGDLYIAYALILASEKWGKHSDLYASVANDLLDDILKYNLNQKTNILTVGNWANEDSKYHNLMRTSDLIPAFFDKFYVFSDNKKWLVIKNAMTDSLYDSSKKNKKGLVPDFIQVTNQQKVVSLTSGQNLKLNTHDNDYYYNAFRVPYNLSFRNNHLSKKEKGILEPMMSFFNKRQKITSGYTMGGKPLNKYQSASISAPILYAASKDRLWKTLYQKQSFILNRDNFEHDYYDDTLLVLILYSNL